MSDDQVKTKSQLLEHIDRDWLIINQFLNSLSDAQWSDIKNADGWAIKDHVAHLTVWEQSVVAFLTGSPRHEGLGIAEDLYLSEDLNAINDAIFRNHQHDSSVQVRINFSSTHQILMGHVLKLTDEDLHKPYVYFLPDEPGEGEGPPAIKVIYGNTAAHYRAHQAWMMEMLGMA